MLSSIETVREFLNKCFEYSDKARIDINRIGRIEVAPEIEGWKRARLFVYYEQGIDLFENRVRFVLEIIDKKIQRPDVLDQILRGLLDSYLRFLFIVRSSEIEKYRRIIWQDLITVCSLSQTPEIAAKLSQASRVLKMDYEILKHFGEDVTKLEMKTIWSEVLYAYENMKFTKNMWKLREKMEFPKMREILINYYNETEDPIIRKIDMNKLYSRFSEQIHGNVYYELTDLPADGGLFRILSSLLLFQMKFLREVSKIARNSEQYNRLLVEFHALKADFSYLWDLSK